VFPASPQVGTIFAALVRKAQAIVGVYGLASHPAIPLIIPKPAWGWIILDAFRARLEA
jgi:hypothetical protein